MKRTCPGVGGSANQPSAVSPPTSTATRSSAIPLAVRVGRPGGYVVITRFVAQILGRELGLRVRAHSRLQQLHLAVIIRLVSQVGAHQAYRRIDAVVRLERFQASG